MNDIRGFADIVKRWEPMEELARDIGQKGVTVRQWAARDFIPAEYWVAISEAARVRRLKGITVRKMADLAAARRVAAE